MRKVKNRKLGDRGGGSEVKRFERIGAYATAARGQGAHSGDIGPLACVEDELITRVTGHV